MVVLFDLDDTLIDHATAIRGAVAALHRELALPGTVADFLEAWTRSHAHHYPRFLSEGVSYEEIRRARVREVIDPQLSDEGADAIFASYFAAYEAGWTLFADARPCLAGLSHHRLGILSNGPGREQRRKLARTGIDQLFEGIFISEEIGSAKPSPEIFRRACAELAVPAPSVIYVGDRYDLDALAARRAGLQGVWLDRHGEATGHHAGPVIRGLDELAALVDR